MTNQLDLFATGAAPAAPVPAPPFRYVAPDPAPDRTTPPFRVVAVSELGRALLADALEGRTFDLLDVADVAALHARYFSDLPPIPGPADFPLLAHDPIAHGREIMRAIVAWVREHSPDSGALDEFCERHGLLAATCAGQGPCRMYHSAPFPDAAAFAYWIADGKGYRDLARCGQYRASFAWAVARGWRDLCAHNADPDRLTTYRMDDDTGAQVPSDDFHPERAILASGAYEGAPIIQSAVIRGPRRYMERPAWWPKDGAKARTGAKPRHLEHIDFGLGIDLYLELMPTPAFLDAVARERDEAAKKPAPRVIVDDEDEEDDEGDFDDDDEPIDDDEEPIDDDTQTGLFA